MEENLTEQNSIASMIIKGCITFRKHHLFDNSIFFYPYAVAGDVEDISQGKNLQKLGCRVTKEFDVVRNCINTNMTFFEKSEDDYHFEDDYQIGMRANLPNCNVAYGSDTFFYENEGVCIDGKFILTEDNRNYISLYCLKDESLAIHFVADDLIRDTLLNQEFERYRTSCEIINPKKEVMKSIDLERTKIECVTNEQEE